MKTKIALILTLVLLLLVFAGCQRTPAAAGDNTSGSTQASTDSAAALPDNTSAPTNDTAAATDSTTAPTDNTTGTAAASTDVKLTAAEAEKIALEHANLTADQVTRLHTEKDLDERIPHYDVEFHADGYEYDYEINAQTGEILKSEKEWD